MYGEILVGHILLVYSCILALYILMIPLLLHLKGSTMICNLYKMYTTEVIQAK